jgi:RNA polymerase sigma-70 factor (ECF subfamily)
MDQRERFTELYAAYMPSILGFAARRVDTAADASDVTAEVFVVAWRRIGEVPPGDQARLWLYGVARGVMANHRRGKARSERLGQALLDAWREAADSDPAELFERREATRAVANALALLRVIDRDLLTLTAWEGLSAAEAAQIVGIRPDAARTRISRARRRLRERLGEAVQPFDDPSFLRPATEVQP